jgi:hypothetical protein
MSESDKPKEPPPPPPPTSVPTKGRDYQSNDNPPSPTIPRPIKPE